MRIANYSHGVLLIHEGLDTVDHVLDKLLLGFSESSSVRDIEDTIVGLSVLSVDTSDLDFILISHLIESCLISHQLWKFDVDGSSHGGTKVGWAGSDVTEMIVMGELANGLNMCGSSAESLEHLSNIGTWLHRDNSQLILLVDPNKECLGIVMENASARWPVSVETASIKESVTLPV